jgi:hypothetical protein
MTDPVIRFAEDSVINAAARALRLDFSADAYAALLELAQQRCLPGVLETLALYRRTESIPCFLRALESDLARSAAMQSLQLFGQAAQPYLWTEALRPEPGPPDRENASSLHRRRACLKLLEPLTLSALEREKLLDLLFETDSELVMNAGAILLSSSNQQERAAAYRRFRAALPHVDWWLRDELMELLSRFEKAGTKA